MILHRPAFARSSMLALALALVPTGCGKGSGGGGGDDAGSTDYAATPLAGTIAGATWTYGSGRVKPRDISTGEADFGSFELFSEVVPDLCKVIVHEPADKKMVLFSTAMKVGEVQLGLKTRTVTLYDNSTGQNSNVIASTGKLALDEVATGAIKGRLYATFDENNTVNGTFTVEKCCLAADGFTFETCK